jgi:hypothetical protein
MVADRVVVVVDAKVHSGDGVFVVRDRFFDILNDG